ncbi:hypothetical protein LBK6_03335 [Leptospira borgpetersenii serovar Hardjo]|nr:hypothetical protein LBK6_03335 [Leptospira borgpetersenii serovar Hardjo]AMX60668.1 hypothetical protein LBK9_03280 [Leptospira borgpetersenii serovar Hardjo]AMX63912.1 hypothetical protein LBK30_03320 [Leptospira borgpetersenii serovar Hardjo]AMX67153.1 hypothetical protein LBHA_03295 [Leptospira borgpetersenii serovar Hardjo]AMX72165.1 hypothetical protein LBHB_13245 [Leptospira borgpetersenii serovar Hardjo]
MSPVDFMGNNFNKTNYFEKNFKVCSKTLKFVSSIINKSIIENAQFPQITFPLWFGLLKCFIERIFFFQKVSISRILSEKNNNTDTRWNRICRVCDFLLGIPEIEDMFRIDFL